LIFTVSSDKVDLCSRNHISAYGLRVICEHIEQLVGRHIVHTQVAWTPDRNSGNSDRVQVLRRPLNYRRSLGRRLVQSSVSQNEPLKYRFVSTEQYTHACQEVGDTLRGDKIQHEQLCGNIFIASSCIRQLKARPA